MRENGDGEGEWAYAVDEDQFVGAGVKLSQSSELRVSERLAKMRLSRRKGWEKAP